MSPVIEGKISDTGQIFGARTGDEAAELALNLRAGSLPAPVRALAQQTVGPLSGRIRSGRDYAPAPRDWERWRRR